MRRSPPTAAAGRALSSRAPAWGTENPGPFWRRHSRTTQRKLPPGSQVPGPRHDGGRAVLRSRSQRAGEQSGVTGTCYCKGDWRGHRCFLGSALSCHLKRRSGKARWGPGPDPRSGPQVCGRGCEQAVAGSGCFLVPARDTCRTAGPSPSFLLSFYFLFSFLLFLFFSLCSS